jgi:hypothetical protein
MIMSAWHACAYALWCLVAWPQPCTSGVKPTCVGSTWEAQHVPPTDYCTEGVSCWSQAVKASRAEAQAAEAAMLAHATAASLADSPAAGGTAAAVSRPGGAADTSPPPAARAMDLTAADDVPAAASGKLPPPEWFEIEEDEYPVAQQGLIGKVGCSPHVHIWTYVAPAASAVHQRPG